MQYYLHGQKCRQNQTRPDNQCNTPPVRKGEGITKEAFNQHQGKADRNKGFADKSNDESNHRHLAFTFSCIT